LKIEENSQDIANIQPNTDAALDQNQAGSGEVGKRGRTFSLNIERVDHANAQDDQQEQIMLEEHSYRETSQDAEPRSESKQGQLTERDGAEAGATPRTKVLAKSCKTQKGKIDHRASAKRIRTLFQETISTKVKKQEKYIIN
jgi:hypothetical protein